jgi:hypothetical protein
VYNANQPMHHGLQGVKKRKHEKPSMYISSTFSSICNLLTFQIRAGQMQLLRLPITDKGKGGS